MPVEPLTGTTVLITGAAKRLGARIAERLAEQGARLVLHYHQSSSDVEALAERVRSFGTPVWVVAADLSVPEAVSELWEQVIQKVGKIDFLINNASVFPENTLETMTISEVMDSLNINTFAPFILARALAKQQQPGGVINLLDTRIADADRAHAAYHLSKRMLFTLTRMMAMEYAPLVRVNAVAPGLILPPEGKGQDYLEGLAHTNPLNQIGTPEDVARAVLFLIESTFITGQVIFVDGGRHMRGNMYGC